MSVYWLMGLIQFLVLGTFLAMVAMYPKQLVTEREKPVMQGITTVVAILAIFGLAIMARG